MHPTLRKSLVLAVLAAFALEPAVAEAPGSGSAAEMQVEEPADPARPPIDPDREAATWKAKSGSPALDRAERAALEARRRQVEAMAFEVREKRRALEGADLAERAARVKELEALLLDGAGNLDDARKLKQLEKLLEKRVEAQEKQVEQQEKRLEQTEKKIEQQAKEVEKQEKRLEKDLEKKLEKLEMEKEKGGKGPKAK